tara:strand:+ start:921 stop:1340 length:420 start_codon:yes stop_codon:yes gene_type:complete
MFTKGTNNVVMNVYSVQRGYANPKYSRYLTSADDYGARKEIEYEFGEGACFERVGQVIVDRDEHYKKVGGRKGKWFTNWQNDRLRCLSSVFMYNSYTLKGKRVVQQDCNTSSNNPKDSHRDAIKERIRELKFARFERQS